MTLSLAVSVKASSTPSACKKLSSKSLDVSANKTHVSNRQSAHDRTGPSAGKQAYMANHTPDHCSAMPAAKGPSSLRQTPSAPLSTARPVLSTYCIASPSRGGRTRLSATSTHLRCLASATPVVYVATHQPKTGPPHFKRCLARLHFPAAVLSFGTASLSASDEVR